MTRLMVSLMVAAVVLTGCGARSPLPAGIGLSSVRAAGSIVPPGEPIYPYPAPGVTPSPSAKPVSSTKAPASRAILPPSERPTPKPCYPTATPPWHPGANSRAILPPGYQPGC